MNRILTAILLFIVLLLLVSAAIADNSYRVLQLGDFGSDVLALKQRMYYLGYFTSFTNLSDKYNDVMSKRIKMLQKNNGLEQTGIATPELQELIFSEDCVFVAPTPKPTPVPTPAPTPIAPADTPVIPAQDSDGFLADVAVDPFVYENEEEGHWLYVSRNIQVEIKRFNDPTIPLIWFETHMKLREGIPLRSFLSLNKGKISGHNFMLPQNILSDYGHVIVAFSDDFFGYRWKYNTPQGIIIRNGEIISTKTRANNNKAWPQLDLFAVFENGIAQTFNSSEHTAEELLEMGVRDTYAFGPILVQEGNISEDVYAYAHAQTRVEPRTAIGWIAPNEYLELTVMGRRKDSKGATILWLAEQMVACGVREALNLDGGNTCSLFFMGTMINRSKLVQNKDIRRVTGMIGIIEGE